MLVVAFGVFTIPSSQYYREIDFYYVKVISTKYCL